MSDPPLDISSICCEYLKNLSGEIRVSVTFMSADGHLDFVLIFFCGSNLHIVDNIIKICNEHI